MKNSWPSPVASPLTLADGEEGESSLTLLRRHTHLTCPTESVSLGLLHNVGPSSFQMCLMTARQLSDHCDDDFNSETSPSTLTASLAADLGHTQIAGFHLVGGEGGHLLPP